MPLQLLSLALLGQALSLWSLAAGCVPATQQVLPMAIALEPLQAEPGLWVRGSAGTPSVA